MVVLKVVPKPRPLSRSVPENQTKRIKWTGIASDIVFVRYVQSSTNIERRSTMWAAIMAVAYNTA